MFAVGKMPQSTSMESSTLVNEPSTQVLTNFDILEVIFEYFGDHTEGILSPRYENPVKPSTKKDLLWASLTSRSFVGPAINVLWRHMSSLWPLFHLLPTLCKNEDGHYTLTGPVDESHLQLVCFYGSRIKVLHVNGNGYSSQTSSALLIPVFDRIQKSGGFSSLLRLFISFDRLNSPQVIPLENIVAAPHLHTLHLKTYLHENAYRTVDFLRSLPSTVHNIRRLDMIGNFSAIDPNLPTFTNVQELCISVADAILPPCFLQGCASSMLSLQTLKVHLFSDPNSNPQDTLVTVTAAASHRHEPVTFGSLSTFQIAGFPKPVRDVVDVVHAPLLDTLIFGLLRAEPTDISACVSRFIQVNGQHAREGLKKLYIGFDLCAPFEFTSRLEQYRFFERLEGFGFSSQDFQITLPDLTKLLNNDEHWSNLQNLTLTCGRSEKPGKTLSIIALRVIAKACRNLLKLEIAIYNPDQSEVLQTKESSDTHGLGALWFKGLPEEWDYSPSLAVTFASFLRCLFPKLKVAECHESRKEWWGHVRAELRRN